MPTRADYVGLGMPVFLAGLAGISVVSMTAAGAAIGSATPIAGHQQIIYVTTTNSGSGLKLPQITGDGGCKLSDMILVFNFLGAAIQVYASNSCTITGSGASASGNTGVTVATCNGVAFYPITTSSWIYNKFGSA